MGWGWGDDEPDARTVLEADGAARQSKLVQAWTRRDLNPANRVRRCVSVARLRALNRVAMTGLIATAGELRMRSDIEIFGSNHELPPHDQVPELVEDACRFWDSHHSRDAVFLAAYFLWRI